MNNKVIPYKSLSRFEGKNLGTVVLCGGCFDIFHYGHLTFLTAAKSAGETLIVQVESDEFIRLRKKREPVHTQNQRCEIIASLMMVDFVLPIPLFTSDKEYGNVVQVLKPAIIAVTKGDVNLAKKRTHAGVVGAEVREVCAPFASFSSSNIGKYEGIFSD